MSTGLPIVASDVPGIRNLLGGQLVCGVLVKEQCPQSFADAVIELEKDSQRLEVLANASRQLALYSYSHNEMFAGYMKALKVG